MKKNCLVILSLLLVTMSISAQHGKFKKIENPIGGSYIVVLKDSPDQAVFAAERVTELSTALNRKYGGNVERLFSSALRGFSIRMTAKQAQLLSQDPSVKYVEEEGISRIAQSYQTQINAPWGLDRIDQLDLPLNQLYNYRTTGVGAHVYVLDTGILTSHTEFGGRADAVADFISGIPSGTDCFGHGTSVAAIIGGSTYGVAKNARLHSVRVGDCNGNIPNSALIAGLDWVSQNRIYPAVINLSLRGPASQAIDDAVAYNHLVGIVVVAGAGNDNQDACNYSPARVPQILTVGASNQYDERVVNFVFGSNYGSCVDIFAPGELILTATNTSNTSSGYVSGTSFATPHVAGAVALYMESDSVAGSNKPIDKILSSATTGRLSNIGVGSPNRLLYSFFEVVPNTCNVTGATLRRCANDGGQWNYSTCECDFYDFGGEF